MTSVSLTRCKHMAKLLTTLIVATPFLWAAASGPPLGTIIIPNGGALPKLVDIAASSGPYTLTMIAQEIQAGTVATMTRHSDNKNFRLHAGTLCMTNQSASRRFSLFSHGIEQAVKIPLNQDSVNSN